MASQANVLGALAVLLVDRSCRQPYIQLEPNWSTLFAMAGWLPGYNKPWATARREAAAKVLSSAMQRDGEARARLIESGALKAVLALLDQQVGALQGVGLLLLTHVEVGSAAMSLDALLVGKFNASVYALACDVC